MKIKVLLAAVAALFISVSASAGLNLPADFTRDGFVTAGVGGTLTMEGLLSKNFQGGVSPVIDLSIGKWVTPSLGFRVGYQGWKTRTAKTWQNNGTAHGDLLWNMLNTFMPYDKDRAYSLIPYVEAGFMSSQATTTSIIAGVGLLNVIRINDIFAVDIDLRGTYVRGAQFGGAGKSAIGAAVVGVMVTLPSNR